MMNGVQLRLVLMLTFLSKDPSAPSADVSPISFLKGGDAGPKFVQVIFLQTPFTTE